MFPEPSARITTIVENGSDGWELFAKARRMKAEGRDVVELTVGQHDIPTDPLILNEMHRAAMAGHTGYAALPGTDALRRRIAERVTSRTGVPTGPENVLVTPGGQSALFAAHMAALDPGDTGLFIEPYYATYPGTIRAAGGIPVSVPARPDHGFQPRKADLDAATQARSLLINSPNNPTGAVYTGDTLQGLADFAAERGLWLISDEVYESQVWDGRHLSPRALPEMAPRTLVIGSMSKTYAMTGSRIGWLIGPAEVIENVIHLTTHTTYGVAGFIQDAACFALGLGPAFEENLAAPFRRRRDLALARLARQNLLHPVPSEGTMYLMLDIRETGMSGVAFANGLLDARDIAVMPGESFGRQAAGHIRVALTVEDAVLDRAIAEIIDFAQDWRR